MVEMLFIKLQSGLELQKNRWNHR